MPWMEKVYPARLRNLSGSPSAHPLNSYALPDTLSPSKALTCYSLYLNSYMFHVVEDLVDCWGHGCCSGFACCWGHGCCSGWSICWRYCHRCGTVHCHKRLNTAHVTSCWDSELFTTAKHENDVILKNLLVLLMYNNDAQHSNDAYKINVHTRHIMFS